MDRATQSPSLVLVVMDGITLLRGKLLPIVASCAAVTIPAEVVQNRLDTTLNSGGQPVAAATLWPDVGFLFLLYGVLLPLATAAVTAFVAQAYTSNGRSFGAAVARAVSIFPPFVATTWLYYLGLAASSLLLVLPAVYFLVCWVLVDPVAVVEGTYGVSALRRSRQLVDGHWWRAFGLGVAWVTLHTVVTATLRGLLVVEFPLLSAVVVGVVGAVLLAGALSVVTVLFFELRNLEEGRKPGAQIAPVPDEPGLPLAH